MKDDIDAKGKQICQLESLRAASEEKRRHARCLKALKGRLKEAQDEGAQLKNVLRTMSKERVHLIAQVRCESGRRASSQELSRGLEDFKEPIDVSISYHLLVFEFCILTRILAIPRAARGVSW